MFLNVLKVKLEEIEVVVWVTYLSNSPKFRSEVWLAKSNNSIVKKNIMDYVFFIMFYTNLNFFRLTLPRTDSSPTERRKPTLQLFVVDFNKKTRNSVWHIQTKSLLKKVFFKGKTLMSDVTNHMMTTLLLTPHRRGCVGNVDQIQMCRFYWLDRVNVKWGWGLHVDPLFKQQNGGERMKKEERKRGGSCFV